MESNENRKNPENEELERYSFKEMENEGHPLDYDKNFDGLEESASKPSAGETTGTSADMEELLEGILSSIGEGLSKVTEDIQKTIEETRSSIAELQKTSVEGEVGKLQEQVIPGLKSLSESLEKIDQFLVTKDERNEIEKLQDQMVENISKMEESLKTQAERVDKLELRTKDLIKNIVKKIIGVEVSNQSDKIILANMNLLYEEYREAQKMEVFFSKQDYATMKDKISSFFQLKEMELENITFKEDTNIKRGSFLILSDKGNFDSNIEEKMKLIIDSIL